MLYGSMLNRLAQPKIGKTVSLYLMAASFLAVLFFLWECFFYSTEKNFAKILEEGRRPAQVRKVSKTTLEKKPEWSEYEKLVGGKVIFKAGPVIETVSPVLSRNPFPQPGSLGVGGAAVPGVSDEVILVGILPGAVPQAILEDRKAQKTYYLSPGQSSGEISVESIHEGSVTVNIGAEKKKLAL